MTKMKQKDERKRQTTSVPAPMQAGSMIVQSDVPPEYVRVEGPGRGSENVGTEDLIIPRLEIVQALSPAITPNDPGFIPGAKQGDLINSASRKVYGDSVFVVPVHYSKLWLVWRDRQAGGGFLGAYGTPQEAEARAEKEGGQKAGVSIVDTPTHLCLLIDTKSGEVNEIMISMPRTKAKISRQWNSMIKLAGGDRFSRVYRIGTQSQKNAKGTFYNFTVAQLGFPVRPVYEAAEKLYEAIQSGQRKVVMDTRFMSPGSAEPDDVDADM